MKQIIYDDENAARFVENIKGWVDVNNRFFGNHSESEHMARWSSCTHQKCKICGEIITKGYSKCNVCSSKEEIERYNKLPFKEYDGSLVYSKLSDKYFKYDDEIEEYCNEEGLEPKDLMLVFCTPNRFGEIDSEYWEDILPEDGELPAKLQEAIDVLNKVILSLPPASYSPCNIRTEIKQK